MGASLSIWFIGGRTRPGFQPTTFFSTFFSHLCISRMYVCWYLRYVWFFDQEIWESIYGIFPEMNIIFSFHLPFCILTDCLPRPGAPDHASLFSLSSYLSYKLIKESRFFIYLTATEPKSIKHIRKWAENYVWVGLSSARFHIAYV